MRPRDPAEGHRAASPLELLFDLVFVVAVGFAASNLHEIEAEGHVSSAILSFAFVFFAIWWAWINFTWFATSFDTDDWLYRVATFVQMAGVLVLAAGVGPAMHGEAPVVVVIGYVVMRLALVAQWVRAGVSAPQYRSTATRYVVGVVVVQALWVALLAVPHAAAPAVIPFLVLFELLVPVWAESSSETTPWHTRHIAERYSLFTLIVLGEGLVASANAVIDGLRHAEHLGPLLTLAGGGLVVVAGLWWIYFAREQHEHIRGLPSALVFGYGHYVVFAAAAALPAGIEVAVSADAGEADLTRASVAATIAVPVALFVAAVWALALRPTLAPRWNVTVVALVLVVLASIAVPTASLVVTALAVAAIVVVLEVAERSPVD
ncbi:low temperature requirement protein A [Curtobacterium sp. Leaf183]|nr:low temperature requirement protein A [Curtobacterium sp. Leaf183]